MAEAVVYRFEAVEVEVQDGEAGLGGGAKVFEKAFDRLDEIISVWQTGQCIVVSGVLQSLVALPQLLSALLQLSNVVLKLAEVHFSLFRAVPFCLFGFCSRVLDIDDVAPKG